MNTLDVVLVAVFVGCVALAAALAVAEVSFIRVARGRVLVDADGGDARARQLLGLLDDFPVVLNSVLLMVLLVQVVAASIAGFLAQRWFGGVGVTVTTVVVTIVLFVYAEAIPKTIAVRSPAVWARRVTPLLRVVATIMRPLVAGLVWLADLQSPGHDTMVGALTEDELRALARESASAGTIEEDDAELVDRSFEFGDLVVGDVMVPRERIVCAYADATAAGSFAASVDSGHRRFPVANAGLDDLVGLVRLRDIAAAARSRPATRVSEIMVDLLRCRADDPIAGLLDEMQARESWLAIATDADGATIGLVTIEDIVAELVGEITDEPTSGG